MISLSNNSNEIHLAIGIYGIIIIFCSIIVLRLLYRYIIRLIIYKKLRKILPIWIDINKLKLNTIFYPYFYINISPVFEKEIYSFNIEINRFGKIIYMNNLSEWIKTYSELNRDKILQNNRDKVLENLGI